jgi:predicted RNA-binding Zn ribbon-like protein
MPAMPSTSEVARNGLSEFIFIGEHPAIDFANTYSTPNGEGREHLRAWSDMIEWLSLTGLSAGDQMTSTHGVGALRKVVELRQAWRAELARLISGEKVSDEFLECINNLLLDDIIHEKLCRDEGTSFRLARSTSQLRGVKLALALLGHQIAGFLVEANLSYLHRCANTTSCVLYFYDTTKNHRRQWCSVATCGNRHKVAQFRKRHGRN